jgi:adenylate kinase family enzyme
MKKKIKRLHIIGASGSGKTTLAKKLSKELNLPHFDLDDVRYPPKINKVRPTKERVPHAMRLAKQDEWLIEGIYTNNWVSEILKKADQIIWLDMPLHVTLPRIIKRHIKQRITGQDRYGFISFLQLVKFAFDYHFPDQKNFLSEEDFALSREKAEKILAGYEEKVLRVRSVDEMDKVMSVVKLSK